MRAIASSPQLPTPRELARRRNADKLVSPQRSSATQISMHLQLFSAVFELYLKELNHNQYLFWNSCEFARVGALLTDTVIGTHTISILSHLLRFFTPSLSPRANPVKPSPKTKEAISEATGTRDKQIQQHLLQEPQHARNGRKGNITTKSIK